MSETFDLFARGAGYPEAPGFKSDGPSKEAARAIAPFAKTIRGAVLRHFCGLHPIGSTVDELARDLKLSPFTARPRVSELHTQGLLEQTAERRPNDSGHAATVWRASPKALKEIHHG